MTRVQFLNDLYHHLHGMTPEQAEQHLTYYAEMLADRMEEGMSEEEAVAGMEDVETIARRILEEEGLAYIPPEDRPVTPPAYPDVTRLGSGGGDSSGGGSGLRFPHRWHRPVQIALSAAAAAAICIVLFARINDRPAPSRETPPDLTDNVVEEVYPEEYDLSAPYDEGFEYPGFSGEYPASDYNRLDIQWASGVVYVQSCSGDAIRIEEYGQSDLSNRTQLECQEGDGALTIRYRAGTGLGNVKGGKWLTVLVPDGLLEELTVATTSAAVCLNGLEMGKVQVSTTSGDIIPSYCFARRAELSSVSADIHLSGLYAEELNISSVSGDISGDMYQTLRASVSTTSSDIFLSTADSIENLALHTVSGDIYAYVENTSAKQIDVGSTSGDVSLSLPYDLGFSLDFSTVSGSRDISYDMVLQDGRELYNGGGCEIKVETISGGLSIY